MSLPRYLKNNWIKFEKSLNEYGQLSHKAVSKIKHEYKKQFYCIDRYYRDLYKNNTYDKMYEIFTHVCYEKNYRIVIPYKNGKYRYKDAHIVCNQYKLITIGCKNFINFIKYLDLFSRVNHISLLHNTGNAVICTNIEYMRYNRLIEKLDRLKYIYNNKSNLRLFPVSIKVRIFERDNYTCQICGKHKDYLEQDNHLEVDHIHEWSDGGKTTFNNGQTVCAKCNKGKHHAKKYLQFG